MSNDVDDGSRSSTALRWWNAPTTRDRGRTAAACSAADPPPPAARRRPACRSPAGSRSRRRPCRRARPRGTRAARGGPPTGRRRSRGRRSPRTRRWTHPSTPCPILGGDRRGPRRVARPEHDALPARARAVRRGRGPARRSRRAHRRGGGRRQGGRAGSTRTASLMPGSSSPTARPARWVHGRPAGRRASRAAVDDRLGRPDPLLRAHDAPLARPRRAGCSLVGTPDEEPWHLTAHLSDEARISGIPELAPTLVRWQVPRGRTAAPVVHARSGSRRHVAARPCWSSPRRPRRRHCSSGPGTPASSAPRCSPSTAGDAELQGVAHESLTVVTNDLVRPRGVLRHRPAPGERGRRRDRTRRRGRSAAAASGDRLGHLLDVVSGPSRSPLTSSAIPLPELPPLPHPRHP